jgi:DNA repair exonuclease SbcCD ATPase subunit
MRNKIAISLVLLLATISIYAQQRDKNSIRIVDTLSAQEKINRNPVILKTELDSLIKQYNISQVPVQLNEPIKEVKDNTSRYMFIVMIIVLLLIGWLLYLFYRHQKKFNRVVVHLQRQLQYAGINSDSSASSSISLKEKNKVKIATQVLEKKITDLNAELHKLTKENESLNRLVKEYNGIQHEYDSLKHGISKTYKVRNYPGYDKDKEETPVLQAVLETENYVANYAYEKFLKPILAITDSNKNNPAKINAEDSEKLLDLLVSLSLLYIEYLYLRVNDLSIGGKMVERIQGLKNGNGLDHSLLKKLNTEHGSRALVLRMVLDKTRLHQLSYPVFDETDLNNQ